MKNIRFWELIGWIKRGKQRREVIKLFPDKPITAEEFRKYLNSKNSLKLSLREMSRHLTSFTKQGLLKCLTPNAPYGRLYVLTNLGKKAKKEATEKVIEII